VPAAYVQLESLPLTPNGKLDRKALPAPQSDAYGRGEYEEPRGEIEQALAQIWQPLLQVKRISRHDNFFELGGHSLLATRMIAQLRERLLTKSSLRTLFEASTITLFAARVEAERKRQQETEAQRLMLRRAQIIAEIEKMSPEEITSLWSKKMRQ
jgi:hypothetical protein